MRRLLLFSAALSVLFCVLLIATRVIGEATPWPFNIADRAPFPSTGTFDALIPARLGPYIALSRNPVLANSDGIRSGAAFYSLGDDLVRGGLTVTQFQNDNIKNYGVTMRGSGVLIFTVHDTAMTYTFAQYYSSKSHYVMLTYVHDGWAVSLWGDTLSTLSDLVRLYPH